MNQNSNLSFDQLKEKKSALTSQMVDLMTKIRSFGISKNQLEYKPHTVNKYALQKKDKLVYEYNEIQKEVIAINKELNNKKYEQPKSENGVFKEIIEETFPLDVLQKIRAECANRRNGGSPKKIELGFDVMENSSLKIQRQNRLLLKYYKALISAREALNKFIEINIDNNNKSELLNKTLAINHSLPTVSELEKEKRINEF